MERKEIAEGPINTDLENCTVQYTEKTQKRKLGIADGQFIVPEDIDECNEEIAALFEVEE